jgi:Flp pilus assembly protein protease CpaA
MDIFSIAGAIIFLLCAFAIVFWFLKKVPVPEPFNYILYAVMAMVALLVLYWIFGLIGGGDFGHMGHVSHPCG